VTGKLFPIRRLDGDAAALSDEAVLAAVATGDLAALDALFERFHAAVFRFVGRLAAADQAARDDLVQATFLEVRRGATGFRGGSSVKTWILGIAANLARRHLRGERRHREKNARYSEIFAVVPAWPDERLERREVMREIEDALTQLPHDQQVAFILCDLEEIPGVEVARALGVPQGTVWRRLHVARKAVRAAVEKATR
jgi:RNA polymerase sigma-70 factor (ECF subfamily)